MNFKKPSTKTLGEHASLIGGGILGATTSNGVFGLIHKPSGSRDIAVMAKEKNAALLKRGGIAIAAGVAGAAIQGNDLVTTIVKGALIGMSIGQSVEIVKGIAKKNPAVSAVLLNPKGSVQVFAKNSLGFGLGCSCDEEENEMLGKASSTQVCYRRNPDGSHTTYSQINGECPYGGVKSSGLGKPRRRALRGLEMDSWGEDENMIQENYLSEPYVSANILEEAANMGAMVN